ncbi:ABC transporter ATP-binding protein [Streptococcus bovimastitidis]|uniref:ABC transporter ATP-binding protein n=1 Tax=Streptococcus bovimastitidis TaxID=1856638 RepID=A0A1L8MLZ4_9STRE|nr:ABC transporter ATP-binding protein [Streptococcus bovimastitidis]OJF71773.1 ABC transporter ATP-binding protein [Streptococcus bovimastitidis]
MTTLIEAKNVSKKYGNKQVLNQLNLTIEKGSLVAYLGTNGAGKSTTIKILTGLLKASSGTVIKDKDIKIGMVFQDSILDGDLKVIDNLKNRFKLYKDQDKEWFNKMIDLTGIDQILNQKYKTLSGGQRRRVDIARALIHKPNILFLDEPTTGLDIQSRESLWHLFRKLQKEEQLTLFLTTHYLEEAENAEMTYVIDKGNILAMGSSQELIEKYAKSHLHLSFEKPQADPDNSVQVVEDLDLEGLDARETLAVLNHYQAQIKDFDYQKGNINDAFLAITGKEMES